MVRPNRPPLSGEVEIDESYLGGPEPGKSGQGAGGKQSSPPRWREAWPELWSGSARADCRRLGRCPQSLRREAPRRQRNRTHHGWRGYAQLGKTGYRHIVSVLSKLDRTAAEVLPRVHLLFSLIKRRILGTHQGSVSRKHLHGYLKEFTFRFKTAAAPDESPMAPSGSSASPQQLHLGPSGKSSAALHPANSPLLPDGHGDPFLPILAPPGHLPERSSPSTKGVVGRFW